MMLINGIVLPCFGSMFYNHYTHVAEGSFVVGLEEDLNASNNKTKLDNVGKIVLSPY